MRKIAVLLILATMILSTGLMAQQKGHFSLQYEMSFSTGNLNDFISETSFRGVSAQYRYSVSDNITAGFDLGWNVFYEKRELDTYTYNTISLSGVQYRYQNVVPILASIDYCFAPDQQLMPYLGLGIGAVYVERTLDMGTWTVENKPWQIAMKPELGFLYRVSFNTLLKVSAKYYGGFKTDDLDGQGYFSVNAGVAWDL